MIHQNVDTPHYRLNYLTQCLYLHQDHCIGINIIICSKNVDTPDTASAFTLPANVETPVTFNC